jgi:hypothetical protein
MKILLALGLLFCAAVASAQLDESQLFEATRRAKKPKDEPQAVAQAIDMAFSSATWTTIKISTSGPVVELSRLVTQGYYKRELITLVVTAARAKKPFQEVVAKRRKGAALEEIAVGYGLDYDQVYEAALAIEEIVDKQYLPRFPQRPPQRPRDQPY